MTQALNPYSSSDKKEYFAHFEIRNEILNSRSKHVSQWLHKKITYAATISHTKQ